MKKVYNIINLTEDEDGICEWKYNDDCEWWETDCNRLFQFFNGTPKDAGFEFCPFCRRELLESLDK
jgi:hypothetical protein